MDPIYFQRLLDTRHFTVGNSWDEVTPERIPTERIALDVKMPIIEHLHQAYQRYVHQFGRPPKFFVLNKPAYESLVAYVYLRRRQIIEDGLGHHTDEYRVFGVDVVYHPDQVNPVTVLGDPHFEFFHGGFPDE